MHALSRHSPSLLAYLNHGEFTINLAAHGCEIPDMTQDEIILFTLYFMYEPE